MSPASHGAHMSQIGRTVALLRSHASFGDLVALMKPRVMSLVVFTALVGLLVAPGHLGPLIGFVALLCITAGAGAAGALNMWYDADIDALMARTAMRPIPRGRVSRAEALTFGYCLQRVPLPSLVLRSTLPRRHCSPSRSSSMSSFIRCG